MKKILAMFLTFCMVLGCFAVAGAGAYTPGTYEAEAQGLFGPVKVTVTVDDEPVELTAKEYALLLYLVNNRGIVLSRDKILNEVWGYDSMVVDRTVDWQIKLLRSKLGTSRDCIKTSRGVGYKFEA